MLPIDFDPNREPIPDQPPVDQSTDQLPIDQPDVIGDPYWPDQEAGRVVEQLSLVGVLWALIRRPGQTVTGLQQAFSRHPVEGFLSSEAILESDQTDWAAEEQYPMPRRAITPTRPAAFSAIAGAARRTGMRTGTVLTPAMQGAEISGLGAGHNLTALLGSTSLAVLTVPVARNEKDIPAAFTRSNLIALIGMVAGWVIATVGVGYALLTPPDYNTIGKAIFPIAFILVAIGIALFAAFAVSLMPRARLIREAEVYPRGSIIDWVNTHLLSIVVGAFALIMTGGAWAFNGDNTFTPGGVIFWLLSIFGWLAAFDPTLLRFRWLRRGITGILTLPSHLLMIRTSWSAFALIAIMIIGGYTRLHALSAYPPDMTSDAVEMVLDTQRVAEGARPIFLPTNGGRESMEPYLYVAVLHNIFNVPIDYEGLKLLNGIEGLFNILAVYWLARALLSDEDKNLGNLVSLIAAGLVAVSYWDIVLSRMAERIVLTPIAVCVICVYFIKAVRYNRLRDYVYCGLAFGIGLYTYQAVRILPVMFVICMLITLAMRVRSWPALRRYALYSLALVIMGLAVFTPLARYAVEQPNYFWSRTYGRLFGQDNGEVTVKDPTTGQDVTRPATAQDQIDALKTNINYLGSNTLKAALMFTWSGDRSWFTGTNSGLPEMDTLTGALFLLGVGLWIVRLAVRRDPGDWVVPTTIFAGLLATALALAFTVEVPSATRGSAALPFAYILAAFTGALILRQVWRTFPGWLGTILTGLAIILAFLTIGTANVDRYVHDAIDLSYRPSTLPHNQAGQILKNFSTLYGAGNAFVIAYPYWWDHRALAISASDLGWANNNGVLRDDGGNPPKLSYQQTIAQAIIANFGTSYEVRANRPLLFFVNQNDQQVVNGLQSWLPPGTTVEHITTFDPNQDFLVVLSAPIDCNWLTSHIKIGNNVSANISQDCALTPVVNPPTGGGG